MNYSLSTLKSPPKDVEVLGAQNYRKDKNIRNSQILPTSTEDRDKFFARTILPTAKGSSETADQPKEVQQPQITKQQGLLGKSNKLYYIQRILTFIKKLINSKP